MSQGRAASGAVRASGSFTGAFEFPWPTFWFLLSNYEIPARRGAASVLIRNVSAPGRHRVPARRAPNFAGSIHQTAEQFQNPHHRVVENFDFFPFLDNLLVLVCILRWYSRLCRPSLTV